MKLRWCGNMHLAAASFTKAAVWYSSANVGNFSEDWILIKYLSDDTVHLANAYFHLWRNTFPTHLRSQLEGIQETAVKLDYFSGIIFISWVMKIWTRKSLERIEQKVRCNFNFQNVFKNLWYIRSTFVVWYMIVIWTCTKKKSTRKGSFQV